jgi:glycosyltransferase involved in cell wall biosynthesis
MRSLFRREPYDVIRYRSRDATRFLGTGVLPPADVVHVDTLGLIPLRRVCPPAASVLNHHNIESHMLDRRAASERQPILRALLARQARWTREWERQHAPSFSRNVVVSELDQERLREVAPTARSAIVPNGVDTKYFSSPANGEQGNHRIVIVGTHAWYPNRDAALYFLDEIWPQIVAEEPRASWIVIGKDPDERVVQAAQRDERIRVLGFVDDLRKSVAEAAVFVCPFREGGGTRLKVLDALAMRKALVSTYVGAEGIPLEDGHNYLRADTAELFARQVIRLFRDPDLRVRLGDAGRELVVSRFDWSRVGADLYQAYEAAIEATS